jgi:GR25 family glycosyltransferase involved in LPS biosynthesis
MKGYVVTLMNIPESVKFAQRCIKSGKKYNIDIEMFPAVWKTEAMDELKKENLKKSVFDESWSNPEAVIGNFISQYRIWNKIVESGEPGIVFEHDAVVVSNIPDIKGDIVNLGKPSYGNFKKQNKPGEYKMFSKPGGYIPGAHSYYLTPKGAKQLIKVAKQKGAAPCDIYLNKKNFPNIAEVYPWPVEAHDEFSTIQVEKGCIAKHNYNKDYKLL